eukprot:4372173-Amphidinium_carterae.2
MLVKLARSTSKAARFALAGATGSLWYADRRAAAFGGDDGCLVCHRGMGDAYHLLYACPCMQKERSWTPLRMGRFRCKPLLGTCGRMEVLATPGLPSFLIAVRISIEVGYPLTGSRQSVYRAELHAILTAVAASPDGTRIVSDCKAAVSSAKRVQQGVLARRSRNSDLEKRLAAVVTPQHSFVWIRAHQSADSAHTAETDLADWRGNDRADKVAKTALEFWGRVGPPDGLFAWRAHAAKVLNFWGWVGNVLSELTGDAYRPAATGVENPPGEPD